ncbi:MAG: metallophosphoesterase family protein, partial [Aggregatilineales bacterium]
FEDHDVDLTVCCGDLVDRGADGDAVVDLIKSRQVPCIAGNHDRQAPLYQKWITENNIDARDPNISARLLTENTLQFLRDLPDDLRFEWEGLRVLMVHGTPNRIDEYLFPHSPSARFKQIAMDAKADIILSGHTHTPMAVKQRAVYFYNPGSVHRNASRGSNTCAILTLPERKFDVLNLS